MGFPDATRMNSLLTELCRERGWCVEDAADRAQVERAVDAGADAVVDTLIRVEMQMEPTMLDKETRRWLYGKVADWLFDPQGRGVLWGLPL